MAWFKKLTEEGHIKSPGHPLKRAGKLLKGKRKTVPHGPFAESKDVVGGYTLVEARDLEQAIELSKGCCPNPAVLAWQTCPAADSAVKPGSSRGAARR